MEEWVNGWVDGWAGRWVDVPINQSNGVGLNRQMKRSARWGEQPQKHYMNNARHPGQCCDGICEFSGTNGFMKIDGVQLPELGEGRRRQQLEGRVSVGVAGRVLAPDRPSTTHSIMRC